ncbi:MAG: glycosyltransferase family 4 protein [Minisyncoccia bacterium]
MNNQLHGVRNDLQALWRLEPKRYDAVQVRDKPFVAALALWVSHRRGVPFFYWMSFPVSEASIRVARLHGLSLGFLRYAYMVVSGYLGMFILYRIVGPRADYIFVQSERMRQDLTARGIPLHQTMAVPMCVDPEFFSLERISSTCAEFDGREVVAYLGNCERMRRPEFLLNVIAMLKKARPKILLLLIGDAVEEQDRAWLRAEVEARGCREHVRITGWTTPVDAMAYLAQARLAYSLTPPDPILDPATPTKLVEYMAMGKPVVANAHPDQSVVLERSGAGYCLPFDAQAFATATVELLDNPVRAREMGERGRCYVLSHRSYLEMAKQVEAAYRSIMERRNPSKLC